MAALLFVLFLLILLLLVIAKSSKNRIALTIFWVFGILLISFLWILRIYSFVTTTEALYTDVGKINNYLHSNEYAFSYG